MSFIFRRLFNSTTMVSEATVSKVQDLIKQHPVFVASKTYCPYCSATKATLKEFGVDAYIIELDTRDDGSEIQAALHQLTGQNTVPFVFLGGKFIGGNSDLQALNKSGKLKDELKALKL
ncbi:hypothetical protein PACTADRAFT_186020 [Pachysolen tannophilus NRRL Y-2460]|uniref:Glutaredoxin domain-containing protein n=1 Tax=Pachysolen tannophilus NRRL Y-2460 TaxID=669874 RepID=A0A1E4U147_PACTA|nr:hypothetical protein PACTADRAFT_186020 [Pachysolen tannophilus NRRL Y-2460]